jgi:hypothetical protein
MRHARPANLALGVIVITWLALAAAALAAHPRAGAFYSGSLGQGVGFRVARDGKAMSFRGKAEVGVACGPSQPPSGPVLGQFNLSPQSVPRVKIRRNGAFHAFRAEGTVSVRITGRFSGNGRTMVFSVHTTGGGLGACATTKYTLHATGRHVKRRK